MRRAQTLLQEMLYGTPGFTQRARPLRQDDIPPDE
jgi:hypothetical protein